MAKIAIVYYSTWGHIRTLADQLAKSIEEDGGQVTLLQMPETLSNDTLKKMHAPPKDPKVAMATADALTEYDGILFGIPTRFGMAAAQVKAFMDSTGGLWMKQALSGKAAGIFFSTGTQAGGQETTALTFVTQLTHHGMVFVPFGYGHPAIGNMDEITGGSPYGPGTYAGSDGSRKPSKKELDITSAYGKRFVKIAKALSTAN